MRRRRSPVLLSLIALVAVGLAGCLTAGPAAQADGAATVHVPAPEVGGRWELSPVDGADPGATVRLTGSTEHARDGTRRTAPVLRIDAEPLPLEEGVFFQTRYWVHQLGPDGVADVRAEGDLVADIGDEPSRADMDMLDAVPDSGHDRPFSSAFLYGPGLWGETLTVGEERSVPEAMPDGWHRETGPPVFEVVAVEGGCATVHVDAPSILRRVEAELTFCGGSLPERIELVDPIELTYTVEKVATGDPLPDPVRTSEPATDEVGTFPPDGSELPFPLDDAADAISTHPATSTWLDDHSDARAVQGRLRATACRLETTIEAPSTCPSLRNASVLAWRIVLASPDDGGLEVTVRRSLEPEPAPPVVAEVVPTDRTLDDGTVDRAVPLAEALTVADRVRGDDWKRLSVGFWTHGPTPWWSVQGEVRLDGGGTFAGPVNVYWPDGRPEGFVDPLG